MMWKTHLAIGIASMLYFLPYINHKAVFVFVVLATSLLPDVDHENSVFGRRKIFRPIQWIFSHRGFIHSYTLCIAVSFAFALIYPPVAFPFFVGYSFHLAADSFTEKGVRPFWPVEGEIKGPIKVGGPSEYAVFVVFILIDLALLMFQFI